MRLTLLFSVSLLLTCSLTATAIAQVTQTPTTQVADKETSTQNADTPEKNEVELALDEAKKKGEKVLAACLQDCDKGTAITDGVLVGKGIELPKPVYPNMARMAKVSGSVQVMLIIDTDGTVIAAAAIDGHPLLRSACVDAARNSRFSPTTYKGEPVKVTGVIRYDFIGR